MQNNLIFKRSAPAKINLYLDVLGKRPNGYHDIESIMQSVSLSDEITLEISSSSAFKIEISCNLDGIPNDKSNLVWRACIAYLNAIGQSNTNKCFKFHIEKNIPVCAGMAGGSTDCACALRLLNEAYNFTLSDDELFKIGSTLGADVGFCLTGKTAICKGVGDVITPISCPTDFYLVCAIDNSSVSTPEAFKMLDDKYGTSAQAYGLLEKVSNSIENGDLKTLCSLLYNKFESVICTKNPTVEAIKSTLIEYGALGALMSGSGPSVFGIFDNKKTQHNAYEALKSKKIRAFLCKTV